MKTLIWDVECSDLELVHRTYDLRVNITRFHPDNIRRDWTMLGAAWMWLDEDVPKAVTVSHKNPLDDYGVICRLHGILSKADALIGHNSDAFDIKKFNTRAIYYNLPPIAPKQSIDTLKLARKYFKFTSNKLSYICKYLGLTMKDESPDWVKVISGDKQEIRYMMEYNKQDVIATRDLYKRLLSYHHTHPNISPIVRDTSGTPVEGICPKCGSPDTKREGHRFLASGRRRQRWQCNSCRGWFAGKMV